MKIKKKKEQINTSTDAERNVLIHEKNCVILLDDRQCRKNTVLPYLHDREDEFAIKMFLNAKLNHII